MKDYFLEKKKKIQMIYIKKKMQSIMLNIIGKINIIQDAIILK